MKKRVLIVDSCEKQMKHIAYEVYEAAQEMSESVNIYTANSLEEAEHILNYIDMDLLILDTIYAGSPVEEKPGICWVEQLRTMEKYIPLPVIFITSQDEYWEYAYTELNCLGYFSRAFDQKKLRTVLKKGLHHRTQSDEEKYVYLKQKSMVYPVKIKDIVYVEAGNRLIHFYLNDGTELQIPRKTLGEVLEQTKCRSMIQCNKSTLVNMQYIEAAEHACSEIVLGLDMGSLQVGRKFRQPVETALEYRS